MLDNLRKIYERDGQDALGLAGQQWQQLEYVFKMPELKLNVANVVYAGMGDSALAAFMGQGWLGCGVPFDSIRGYDIPSYVSDKTLFIAASYSGSTEETTSALVQAEAKAAQIAVITSGGWLADIARAKGYPLIILPPAIQSRYAMLYGLNALTSLLERSGLVVADAVEAQLHQASAYLHDKIQAWLPTVPTKDNVAKQIALECIGRSVVVYAGAKLAPAAYRWKTGFNENARQVAWWSECSESDHGELMGWTEQPEQKPYAIIDLRSNLDRPKIQSRFELNARLLSGKRPAPIVVRAQGETLLEQLLSTSVLGDFVTIYTALLSNINPTPIELAEKLNKELTA